MSPHIMHENPGPLGHSAVEHAREHARELQNQIARREEQLVAAIFLGFVLFALGVALGILAF